MPSSIGTKISTAPQFVCAVIRNNHLDDEDSRIAHERHKSRLEVGMKSYDLYYYF